MYSSKLHSSVVKIMCSLLLLGLTACGSLSLSKSDTADIKTPEQIEAERLAQERMAVENRLKGEFREALELQQQGDLDGAKAQLTSILEARPDSTSAHFNLGLLELESSDQDSFKSHMEKVLVVDPKHKHALNALGTAARESGDFDAAEQHYRAALDADPLYFPAVKNLAILLDLYRGRLSEALVYYQQAQSLLGEPDPKLKDWIFDLERRIDQ